MNCLCVCWPQQTINPGHLGQWSPSSLSRRQMKLICSCLAVHHHKPHLVRPQFSPGAVKFCIVIHLRFGLSVAECWERAISSQLWGGFLKIMFLKNSVVLNILLKIKYFLLDQNLKIRPTIMEILPLSRICSEMNKIN